MLDTFRHSRNYFPLSTDAKLPGVERFKKEVNVNVCIVCGAVSVVCVNIEARFDYD